MRKCTKCQEEKLDELFAKNKGYCKKCHSEYMKEYFKKNPEKKNKNYQYAKKSGPKLRNQKLEFVWKLKQVPCKDCGLRFHPYIMDFDHLPGSKKEFAVSVMASRKKPEASILKEASKCDVVCSNCHRKRTILRLYGTEDFEKWAGWDLNPRPSP